jgi:hypothetical protein
MRKHASLPKFINIDYEKLRTSFGGNMGLDLGVSTFASGTRFCTSNHEC